MFDLLNKCGFRHLYGYQQLIDGKVTEEIDLAIVDTGFFETDRDLYTVKNKFMKILEFFKFCEFQFEQKKED